MDLYNDFKDYAQKHMGISSLQFHYWEKLQESVYAGGMQVPCVIGSATPYIIEERELRATVIDIFSRLMMDRIIWLVGPVNDRMSTVVQAQLMYLDQNETKDIIFHVDTPGGSVKSGLSIVDVMNYIQSDVATINTGMAASMGSILLGAGAKGKRYSLPFSKVMLHQVSSGFYGNIQDHEINFKETKKYNDILFGLLGEYTNKPAKQVLKDAQRDLWLTAQEAKDYGIIDGIITKKVSK
jgi:ATP-dependent Clp protease, protease subunit